MRFLDHRLGAGAIHDTADAEAADHAAQRLIDAVASGRLLILSPWMHEPNKRTITRAECVALNQMAEEISASH